MIFIYKTITHPSFGHREENTKQGKKGCVENVNTFFRKANRKIEQFYRETPSTVLRGACQNIAIKNQVNCNSTLGWQQLPRKQQQGTDVK